MSNLSGGVLTIEGEGQPSVDDDRRLRPLVALAPRAIFAVLVALYVTSSGSNEALGLFLIAFAGVVTIVSDSRFKFETWLEQHRIPSREAWVSLLVICALLWTGYADSGDVLSVIRTNGDVIGFILAFAIVSDGLGRCGFFHFMAFRLADRCRGNTARLILYLFLLSSILTYFTSNDIVILTMTPIVVSVAFQTRMRNAKLLLLSQFVAANTISMGLLIGSPTNLILGRAVNLNFIQYALLMAGSTLVSFMASFVFVTWVNSWISRRTQRSQIREDERVSHLSGPSSWAYDEKYSAHRSSEFREFSPAMRRWLAVFAASVMILAVATTMEISLLWAAIPIALVGLMMIANEDPGRSPRSGAQQSLSTLRSLPFGIVFFGLAYFLIAQQLGTTPTVQDSIVPRAREVASAHSPLSSIETIGVTGVLVNTMNDLPASAVAGQVLTQVIDSPSGDGKSLSQFDKALTFQGVLTGLNIGTYVTPIGALAGLIWFDVMRRERRRYRADPRYRAAALLTPTRSDLVMYGAASFIFSTVVIGLANWAFIVVVDYLLGPSTGGSKIDQSPLLVVPCLCLLALLPFAFRRALIRNKVALTHLGDFFVVLTRFRLFVSRHRLAVAVTGVGLVFLISALALYEVELIHHSLYPEADRAFDSPREFASWLVVFVSSGFESSRFPISVLGKIVAALLALGGIAIVISIIRLSGSAGNEALRRRIAGGEIQNRRIVILNASDRSLSVIQAVAISSDRFLLLAGDPVDNGELVAWLDGHAPDRSYFLPWSGSIDVIEEFDLASAHEIVLQSSTRSEDLVNVSVLLEIDRRIFTSTNREFESEAGPKFIVEFATSEMVRFFEQRASQAFRDRVQIVQLGREFARFVVSKFSGDLSQLSDFYSIPGSGAVEIAGVTFESDGSRLLLEEQRLPEIAESMVAILRGGEGEVLGVRVARGEDEFTLARPSFSRLLRSEGAATSITGRLVEFGAQELDREVRPEPPILVGWSDVAEEVAALFLELGAENLVMLIPEAAHVERRLEGDSRLRILRFDSVAGLMGAVDSPALAGRQILVFDTDLSLGISVDRILEELSFERLERLERGELPPPVWVQCDSESRREELGRYVVTEIIDSSWIDNSYLTASVSAYFSVRSAVEATSTTEDDIQPDLLISGIVASALMHFEVSIAGDFEFDMPTGESGSVIGLTVTQAQAMSSRSVGQAGSLVGTVGFEFRDQRFVMVTERDDSSRRISETDLLLLVRHI